MKKIIDCIENNKQFGFGEFCFIHDAHSMKMKGKWNAVKQGIEKGMLEISPTGRDDYMIRKKVSDLCEKTG